MFGFVGRIDPGLFSQNGLVLATVALYRRHEAYLAMLVFNAWSVELMKPLIDVLEGIK
jgi:hypothetical protein